MVGYILLKNDNSILGTRDEGHNKVCTLKKDMIYISSIHDTDHFAFCPILTDCHFDTEESGIRVAVIEPIGYSSPIGDSVYYQTLSFKVLDILDDNGIMNLLTNFIPEIKEDSNINGLVALLRYQLVDSQEYLDHDSDTVRKMVVRNGVYNDSTVKDPSFIVRRELARNGIFLDTLVEDASDAVRTQAAKVSCYSSMLLADPSFAVRLEMARSMHGLAHLASDSHPIVRAEVARQYCSIDTLIFDPYINVRLAVVDACIEKNDEDNLMILAHDVDEEVRGAVAKFNPTLSPYFAIDPSPYVRKCTAESIDRNDRLCGVLIYDPDAEVRAALALRGIYDEGHYNYESPEVIDAIRTHKYRRMLKEIFNIVL